MFLQQESGTTQVIDPWGGSYYVERLTRDLAEKAWGHIQEVEETGGMAKAIEAGIPKLRIEEAAARTQARIDSGRQTVVGVNKYLLDQAENIEVLKVENAVVRRQQISQLEELRANRDPVEVEQKRRPRKPVKVMYSHWRWMLHAPDVRSAKSAMLLRKSGVATRQKSEQSLVFTVGRLARCPMP